MKETKVCNKKQKELLLNSLREDYKKIFYIKDTNIKMIAKTDENRDDIIFKVIMDYGLFQSKKVFFEDIIEHIDHNSEGWIKDGEIDNVITIDVTNGIAYLIDKRKLDKIVFLDEQMKNKFYKRKCDRKRNINLYGFYIDLTFLRENDFIKKCYILKEKGDKNEF